MLALFRVETESQAQVLVSSLLALERDPHALAQLEAAMRAAHSLKGAARIVGLSAGVDVAHAMEDCLTRAQHGGARLQKDEIDVLLGGMDLLSAIARLPEAEIATAADRYQGAIADFLAATTAIAHRAESAAPAETTVAEAAPRPEPAAERNDRVLRVTAENLNRVLGLAGEARVGSRWIKPFAQSLLRIKRLQQDVVQTLGTLRESAAAHALDENTLSTLLRADRSAQEAVQMMAQKLVELEVHDSRTASVVNRLYTQAVASRMRPFGDGVQSFPRMLRDVGRQLGKPVRLEITGQSTQIDRDILEKLDAPLGHLLRNAVAHGIETPEGRAEAGKAAEGVIRLDARHSAGLLQVTVADDGRGISTAALAQAIVARNLAGADMVAGLSDAELMEFLFLPGFSMKDTVTDISGRGVGLDVVRNMLKEVRGTVQVSSQPGRGATFLLQLPLTLSVLRALLVEIGAEAYALPLAQVVHALKVPKENIQQLEGRQHFVFEHAPVGIVDASQVIDAGSSVASGEELALVVIGEGKDRHALAVDRFLGESELVVQRLDERLGKIRDVSAGALAEDGTPLLILDVEDILRSIAKLVASGRLTQVARDRRPDAGKRKRVLVVDDSLTVRELERKLIESHGYEVEIAVDGMDGWNAVRTGGFDLVVTDVDMPRMDGIELVGLIRREPNLRTLPVLIISYKDREEDRQRGLDAGADYYLTKGSFQDESLVQAVADLIGEANA